ncbi:hypothetical protein J4732_22770 [Serratia marcescens]|uniref:Uncharacterized protein n=1 Tax=Serratia marcescens TaxID=615 RepID=A0A939NQL1_SERMA|nr:hypothetical protein [Serratia marcescens]
MVVTSTANIATGTAQFNLGAGNDSLHWAGNAVSGGANTVANTVKADGVPARTPSLPTSSPKPS